MYSLIPFYSTYTAKFATANSSAVGNDLAYQLDLLWSHCHQNDTGLLVHGYDASKTAVWANPVTGGSPIVWSRSLGWYMMALVDILEISLQQGVLSQEQWDHVHQRFIALSTAVTAAADPETGCWWQVMTDPNREGNYIESSGSAMFTYALYKGARLGYLHDIVENSLAPTTLASKCYGHLLQDFVVDNKNGTLGYNGTVSVCSLNSNATYEVRAPDNPVFPDQCSANGRNNCSIMSINLSSTTVCMALRPLSSQAWSTSVPITCPEIKGLPHLLL